MRIVEAPHRNASSAMGYGLPLVTGEYLCWPDSDDVLKETSIEERVEFLEKHPEYHCVRSLSWYFDPESGERTAADEKRGDLKKEDLGMSIVVSGLVDHVKECCHKVGLEPHTVESSLGRIGRTDLLPPNEILEIATMCGHSMVSVNFINEMIEKCRKGRCTPEEAAAELFKPCICGIFNTDRAAMLIRKMIEE